MNGPPPQVTVRELLSHRVALQGRFCLWKVCVEGTHITVCVCVGEFVVPFHQVCPGN